MEMGHLGHRMADRLVKGTLSGLATMDVSDRDARDQRSRSRRENLEAIPQHDDQIRAEPGERIGESDHA